jgi:amino acid transporter
VLSVQGSTIFGSSGLGPVFTHLLLLLMVLSSAAASTQTTILPTARTTLSMAAYKELPASFAKTRPRYMTPTAREHAHLHPDPSPNASALQPSWL